MEPISEKHPKNLAKKQGGKPMTYDSSMGSDDGRPGEKNLIMEDLVIW